MFAAGLLHVVAGPSLTGSGAGSRAEEAKKSGRRVQGPTARVGFFAVPLTQTRNPSHCPVGVKAPAPRKGPGHEPRAQPRTGPGRRRGRGGVRPPGHLPGDRPGDGRGAGGADRVRVDPEDRCAPCADRAKRLRIQQCREGWHLDTEPEHAALVTTRRTTTRTRPTRSTVGAGCARPGDARTCPELPRVPMEDRTIGRVYTAPGRQDLPALDVRHPHPGVLRAGHRRGGAGRSRDAMTIGGRRWMRCTSPSWWTGSGRTCAAAPATGSSTSPPSRPNAASPPTSTPPCAARSVAGSCGRCGRRPITRSGGPPTTSRSTSTGCRSGPTGCAATSIPPPARPADLGCGPRRPR